MSHGHTCEKCQRPYRCLQREEKESGGPVCVTRLTKKASDRWCWDCFAKAEILQRIDEMAQGMEQA